MKKLMYIVFVAGALSACQNKYKAEAQAKADSLKMVQDSLKIDSLQRAAEASKATQTSAAPKTEVHNTYVTQQEQKKKGWSNAAKGAVIGGAAGAIGGALIDKKHGQGAIIGGVAGAGAGYLIGHAKDKKTGRAN